MWVRGQREKERNSCGLVAGMCAGTWVVPYSRNATDRHTRVADSRVMEAGRMLTAEEPKVGAVAGAGRGLALHQLFVICWAGLLGR